MINKNKQQNKIIPKKLKFWNIELDGPDKVGKSTIAKYITQLSNYRFATHDRGFMTQVAYAKKFNRPYTYRLPNFNTVYILLTCEKEEHDIRCKITNEPRIDFDKDMSLFTDVFNRLVRLDYKCLIYNTSQDSFYHIAQDIISQINKWEDEND